MQVISATHGNALVLLQDADQPPPDNTDFTFGPVLARMLSQQGSGDVTPHESSTSQAADSVSGHDTAHDTTSQHSESSGRLHDDSVSGASSPDLRISTGHSLPFLVRSQPNMFLGEGSVITPVFRMVSTQRLLIVTNLSLHAAPEPVQVDG